MAAHWAVVRWRSKGSSVTGRVDVTNMTWQDTDDDTLCAVVWGLAPNTALSVMPCVHHVNTKTLWYTMVYLAVRYRYGKQGIKWDKWKTRRLTLNYISVTLCIHSVFSSVRTHLHRYTLRLDCVLPLLVLVYEQKLRNPSRLPVRLKRTTNSY